MTLLFPLSLTAKQSRRIMCDAKQSLWQQFAKSPKIAWSKSTHRKEKGRRERRQTRGLGSKYMSNNWFIAKKEMCLRLKGPCILECQRSRSHISKTLQGRIPPAGRTPAERERSSTFVLLSLWKANFPDNRLWTTHGNMIVAKIWHESGADGEW